MKLLRSKIRDQSDPRIDYVLINTPLEESGYPQTVPSVYDTETIMVWMPRPLYIESFYPVTICHTETNKVYYTFQTSVEFLIWLTSCRRFYAESSWFSPTFSDLLLDPKMVEIILREESSQ